MANPRYNTQVANRRGAMKPNGSMKSAARSMKAGMKKGVGKLPEGLRKFLEKKKGKK